MKTFFVTLLKIALVAFVLWWLLHNAPFVAAPLVGALGIMMIFSVMVLAALLTGLSLGLVVVLVVAAVMLSLAAALSPIWLPLLAIVGLVALCRSPSSKSRSRSTS